MHNVFSFLVALSLVSVAGCASAPMRAGDPGTRVFRSAPYGVVVVYPDTLKQRRGFTGSYLLGQQWNPDAHQAPGEALLQLTLPESNRLTDARLRLGVSDDTDAAQNCRLPEAGHGGSESRVKIGGVTFRRLDTSTAGMSHSLTRHAYRGVAHGNCYAIDLVVSGVSPDVVPGDARPPMSTGQAFGRLHALLAGISFGR